MDAQLLGFPNQSEELYKKLLRVWHLSALSNRRRQ